MKRLLHPTLTLLAALAGPLAVAAPNADSPEALRQALERPVATVNGQSVSTAEAEVLMRQQIAKGASASAQLREQTRQLLIDQQLMAQEARARGLDRQPLVQAQMALAARAVLARVWQEDLLARTPVSDEALRQAYQREVVGQGPDELLVRHILVTDPEQARQLIAALAQGARMDELASQHSQDSDSRAQGGLIGWVPQGQLVPQVVQALNRLQPGQLWSQPVQTERGWHVLMLQERRPWQPPSLEQMRPQLLEQQAQQQLQQQLQGLRQRARIE